MKEVKLTYYQRNKDKYQARSRTNHAARMVRHAWMHTPKPCAWCDRPFRPNGPKHILCSVKCRRSYRWYIGGEKDKPYSNRPESKRRYLENNREAIRDRHNKRKLLEPHKIAARQAVMVALRKGLLSKGVCEKCGASNAHAHHDDYSKPLDVRWFCVKHHNQLHHVKASRKANVAT